jgi:hypothetical protein
MQEYNTQLRIFGITKWNLYKGLIKFYYYMILLIAPYKVLLNLEVLIMTLRKTVSSITVATLLAVSFTGCTGSPKVSSLTTKQVKQEFVRGTTRTNDIRAKYGNPSEENLITWSEAKEMFKVKGQFASRMDGMMNKISNGDPSAENLITWSEAKEIFKVKDQFASMMNKMSKNQVDTAAGIKEIAEGTKEEQSDDNREVEFWVYNDYEIKSTFNLMPGSERKAAKLMLVFDGNETLKDYRFQKYSSR